jgi:hypothetical protein
VKSTPARGVKEYLKPHIYNLWEGYVRKEMPDRVPFASWVGDSVCAARLSRYRCSRSESESEQGVQLHGLDPKPVDLRMDRVKRE